MAAGRLSLSQYMPARDRQGRLVPGARMRVWQNRTTTNAAVFSDAGLNTPLTNPVVANASGRFPEVWVDGGTAEAPTLFTLAFSASDGSTIGNPSVFDDVSTSVVYGADVVADADAAKDAAIVAQVQASDARDLALLAAEEAVAATADKLNLNGANVVNPALLRENIGADQSANVFHILNATGAIERTVDLAINDIEDLSLDQFVPANLRPLVYSGAFFVDPYIQAMIAAAVLKRTVGGVGGVRMNLPPRNLTVTETIDISFGKVSLCGSAQGALRTILQRSADFGPTIRVATLSEGGSLIGTSDVELRHLYLYHDVGTPGAPTPMSDPHVVMAGVTSSKLEDMFVGGGLYGIALYGCTSVHGEKVALSGNYDPVAGPGNPAAHPGKNNLCGVLMATATSYGLPTSGVVNLCTECTFESLTVLGPQLKGYKYGVWATGVEDCSIESSYLGNAAEVNLRVEQLPGSGILEFRVENSYIDASGTYPVWVGGPTGSSEAYIGGLKLIGNDIKGQLGDSIDGIYVDGTDRGGTYPQAVINMMVADCEISGHGRHGLNIRGGREITLSNLKVHGNNYDNLNAGAAGLKIGPGVRGMEVHGGRYGGGAVGELVGFQDYGIHAESGATYVDIKNANVRGNRVANIHDQMAEAGVSKKRIVGNTGFNENRSAVGLTVPPSGVDYYNPFGAPAVLLVSGGTVSSFTLNGQGYPTSFPIFVGPGDRINITYSVAPSGVWWPG